MELVENENSTSTSTSTSTSSAKKSNSKSSPTPPWSEMFRSASSRRPPLSTSSSPPSESDANTKTTESQKKQEKTEEEEETLGLDSHARLALYIAMAHGALAFTVLLLYGLYRLLQDFVRPIQWAVLCSIPLREIQNAIVSFWSEPLSRGLLDTFLAVPFSLFRVSAATVLDIRQACFRVFSRRRRQQPEGGSNNAKHEVGIEKLFQWLMSFGVFVIAYENLGIGAVAIFGLIFLFSNQKAVAAIRNASFSRDRSKSRFAFLTRGILVRLKTLVAIGLIISMIVGVLVGCVFFSYKIGVESKDAVIMIKTHVEESNYAEKIGIKQWLERNDIPGLVERYSAKLSDTVWEQIDSLALQYNLTDAANGCKQFLLTNHSVVIFSPSMGLSNSASLPYTKKLQTLSVHAKNRDWAGIYKELDLLLRELLVTREDLVHAAKEYAFQGMEVSKRLLASGGSVVGGGASLLLSLSLAVLSGAAEVFNFLSQLTVFFWVLYYLITAESGGATEHVISLVPISNERQLRCIEVINHAISSVLLSTAKIAFFQGCMTWLLFRFCSVHFVYVSTIIVILSSLLPIFPPWFSSIPAALQLVVEGNYLFAVGLSLLHLMLMDYGASAILEKTPGHIAYLTEFSILGGMALFPSILEGAIMGPLIMAVMIALKNLYAEFVLGETKE